MARKTKDPTKLSMVKQALAAGVKKPILIVAYVKEKGMDITAGQASNYKSVLKKKAKEEAKAARLLGHRGPGRPKQVAATSNGKAHGYADQVAQLKSIVKELGLAEVKKLAELVA